MVKVLTIAGSDSSGGAGIQADLKTFHAFGVYGTTAITALTAQNIQRVAGVYPVAAKFVGMQIDAVMEEERVVVWKTGMLAHKEIVEIVARSIKKYNIEKVVLDPVLAASSGRRLLEKDAEEVFIKKLLPKAFVVTPNMPEAEILTGGSLQTVEDMKKAAVAIRKMGAKYVVVKGGHLYSSRHPGAQNDSKISKGFWTSQNDKEDKVVDILYDGKRFFALSSPYIRAKNTHGTGCTFASAIASELAKGKTVYKAVESARVYITMMLRKNLL